MKKRYQVFISSTFVDLKDERKMVMQAVLERKCFPAGMELFPAIDKKQFDYIKQVIDDSDYYLLIIGARYGSLDENGISFTEKEYDYAVSKGIPIIAFLHSDIKSLPLAKADVDKVLQEKLEAFKTKVQTGRLVNYWENAHELKANVISSLVDIFDAQPRTGWVRADTVVAWDDVEKEIDKLQKEIKMLKSQVAEKEETCDDDKKSYNGPLPTPTILKRKAELESIRQSVSDQEEPKHVPRYEIFDVNGVEFKMIFVEEGSFTMGATSEQDGYAYDNEKPTHQVVLSSYWIGETQVTQALWKAVMGNKRGWFKDDNNLPVERVSWDDCKEFIKKLNEKTRMHFRLPTEAEWEFAARGGNISQGFKFSGGDDVLDVAWMKRNAEKGTHPVASTDYPNELGLYDMSGNVWEWCEDWYGDYEDKIQTNPKGPNDGEFRVNRGGCWNDSARNCRVSVRGKNKPEDNWSESNGFRLAMEYLPERKK